METKNFEQKTQQIFAKARALDFGASPFLETRVLARIRESEVARTRRSLWLWRGFSVCSGALSLLLVSWIALHRTADNGGLFAPVDRAVVVRVELGDLKALGRVARIRIDLPSGVSFYSQNHQQLSGSSSVLLTVDASKNLSYVPFAVLAKQAGSKPILVRFLDEQSTVVAERILDIRFKEGA
jgi:hypothetical protein